MSDQNAIRVVIFKEGEFFIASGVELDIAAQGKDADKALESLGVVLRAEIQLAEEDGRDLFDIGPAPDMIRQMYEGDDKRLVSRELLAGLPKSF